MALKPRLFSILLLAVFAVSFAGCGAPKSPSGKKLGDLTIRSLTQQGVSLTGKFKTGYYAYHDDNRITLILLDGDEQAPSQLLVARMLWLPRGSKTPVNRNATNATFKYIIYAGADRNIVGVYGGGGYLYPKQKPGKDHLNCAIWHGSMALQHLSKGFADRLGRVQIDGKFKVIRDDQKVASMLKQLESELAKKLGYPIMVKRDALTHVKEM